MATPTKTIPEIPITTSVDVTDVFLVKIATNTIPEKTAWQTMLTQSLSAIPASYYYGP